MQHVDHPVMHLVGDVADTLHRECYVVGGYVRDIFLQRPSNDIDFVTVGSGIQVAQAVADRLGRKAHLSVFRTYGTAQVKTPDWELEFVGARRESYKRSSRNPIVEDGTLSDDQLRRDFTINAMAVCLNAERYGELLDPFDGMGDLERRVIRTPRDPDTTFDDDPLRMMRAVRFATQLQFDIHPVTFSAIKRNASRLTIITRERIADELMKIMRSPQPSRGWKLMDKCGLLPYVCPQVAALKGVETVNGRSHKDNFLHTMQVLDNVASTSDNVWLRWAALLHDIGKPRTKQWDPAVGWTFYSHNLVGEKMIPKIFSQLKLPMDDRMRYVKKLVGLHMRPIALVEDVVTDSAVRRLLFDAGDDIDDLMLLCKADITSKNQDKVRRFRDNFDLVRRKLIDIEEKDRIRNFQPPIDGQDIMTTFNLHPSREVGAIKDAIKDAILDGDITNEYAPAYRLMMRQAATLHLASATSGLLCHTMLPTALGDITLAADDEGLVLVLLPGETDDLNAIADKLGLQLAKRETPLLHQAMTQLSQYFDGTRQRFSLPLHQSGTPFQMSVWAALCDIPYGTTITYRDLAQRVGKPQAYRAVGQANHVNKLPIVVPCHRVIAADGTLGGYAGGLDTKRFLLQLEAEHAAQQA